MPTPVGYDMREGWKEPIMMYSLRCPRCRKMVVDYKHGNNPYFTCPICKAVINA